MKLCFLEYYFFFRRTKRETGMMRIEDSEFPWTYANRRYFDSHARSFSAHHTFTFHIHYFNSQQLTSVILCKELN